jgi:hypothetical protein
MKRTVPLLIAAIAGYVLIASRFIPLAEKWGEVEAIWFDILAAIAFVLGGGSLLKLHLKRISDRAAGWGYSAITLVAFVATLFVGLDKTGARPAQEPEHYGRSFAKLEVADLPGSLTFHVAGSIPIRADGEPLPVSVQRQLSERDGQIEFRGWMLPQQKAELAGYKDQLAWQCLVERLFNLAQPPGELKGKAAYMADYSVLPYKGSMTAAAHAALLKLGKNDAYVAAVEVLWKASREQTEVAADTVPSGFTIPKSMQDVLSYDKAAQKLEIRGPMSIAARDELARDHFPLVRPMTAEQRAAFGTTLESQGDALSKQQKEVLDFLLAKTWSLDKLRGALDEAGGAAPAEKTEKSACELYQDQQKQPGAPAAAPPKNDAERNQKPPAAMPLNERQRAALDGFVAHHNETVDDLVAGLKAAGPFNARQADLLQEFFARVPTIGEQKLELCIELLRVGPLSRAQRDFLRKDYRQQYRWRQIVGDLFVAAHKVKYPWSGQYNSAGSWFGWMYEFMFKPLTATIFALLAFYVASAAFRAFRAKNFEALLLLGTAFIILLSQTFAGYWLTSWLPSDTQTSYWAWLRMENLKILIMRVFTTAGTRAIMIGIALGLASTSVKILLGQDRSYLGSE